MKEYKVIQGRGDSIENKWSGTQYQFPKFETEIAKYLADGWLCQGGVFFSTDHLGDPIRKPYIFQALVK